LVLKPDTANAGHLPLANLSQLLALATCRAIDTCDVTATVKWPNDIQVDGRKLAGILAETVTQGSHFLGLVLGIGINLNLKAETLALIDQPATSLSLQAGQPVDVRHVCNALLCEFCREYDAFMKTGFTMIREEYLRRCHFLGEQIKVRQGSTVIHGRAVDVNTNGALVLTDKEDQVRVVEIAEMFQ
jgi:BirA family biotin operon repressor/biotin-[acetyl-CoA-carboxylase] ligase